MASKYTRTLSDMWDSLGTFWGQFPDKDDITAFWEIYLETIDDLYRRKAVIHLSKNMGTLIPVLTYPNSSYEIVFSGDATNVIEISGLNSYEVPKYTFSIPTLSGVQTVQTLTEGTEYQIHNKNHIQFLTDPDFDPANTGLQDNITLYAEEVYRHNPVLWEIHASGIGLSISSLDNEEYMPYNIIAGSGISRTLDIADHYKYLVWALEDVKRKPPTISNLVRGCGISYGYPFAYRAGLAENVSVSGLDILVSGYNSTSDHYDIPVGSEFKYSNGDFIDQFSLLTSGINFYDHVNNYDYIMSLDGVNEFNYTSRVVFSHRPSVQDAVFSEKLKTFGEELASFYSEPTSYNASFQSAFLDSIVPASLNYTNIEG